MKLYAVTRNSDFTEGRGPMLTDSLWFDRKKALRYMNGKRGIMGRKPLSGSWDSEKFCRDWEIKELVTQDDPIETVVPEVDIPKTISNLERTIIELRKLRPLNWTEEDK